MGLAFDIGFGGFPLRVERVELVLQRRLGGYPRVDRAAQARPCHGSFHEGIPAGAEITAKRSSFALTAFEAVSLAIDPRPSRGTTRRLPPRVLAPTGAPFVWRSPKNLWPFQLVPVTALAICDRLPKFLPFQAKPCSRTMTRSSLPCPSRTNCAPGLKAIPSRVWASRRSNGTLTRFPSASGSS